MKADIIPIGNSRGIRIPKALLEQCGFVDSVEIKMESHSLILTPARSGREGWSKEFQAMAESGDDAMLDAPTTTAFDESEWKW